MTSIEWTDATWNPVVGCSLVSAGCTHCYAMGVAHRGMSPEHRGLTVLRDHGKGPRWNGEVRFLPERLAEPLRWRKPRRVFVNSMSDLFHERLAFDEIAAVFGVMAAAPRHTFQVLTKRPERAKAFFAWIEQQPVSLGGPTVNAARGARWHAWNHIDDLRVHDPAQPWIWPLPNVWLGVSVEDQASADERIPPLLSLPAAVRWVSYEPALGPVDFHRPWRLWAEAGAGYSLDPSLFRAASGSGVGVNWIVVGGESGPGARPFDLAWPRSTVAACREAGVPVFVKQLGAAPHVGDGGAGPASGTTGRHWRMDDPTTDPMTVYEIRDRKGGDMAEWPEDLRVREWPEVTRVCPAEEIARSTAAREVCCEDHERGAAEEHEPCGPRPDRGAPGLGGGDVAKETTKPITMTPEQEAEIRGLDWMPAMVASLITELDATRARVESAEARARELEARAALDGLGGKIEVGVMDNEITDKGGTVDMMQDGPLVAGWEVWFVEGGGERWWLLVKPGEDVRAAMRVSGNWDDEAHITEDAAGARRWTFHESLTMTVRVEDHPTIRMTLAEAAETQACDAARHDHCRVIATTCW